MALTVQLKTSLVLDFTNKAMQHNDEVLEMFKTEEDFQQIEEMSTKNRQKRLHSFAAAKGRYCYITDHDFHAANVSINSSNSVSDAISVWEAYNAKIRRPQEDIDQFLDLHRDLIERAQQKKRSASVEEDSDTGSSRSSPMKRNKAANENSERPKENLAASSQSLLASRELIGLESRYTQLMEIL